MEESSNYEQTVHGNELASSYLKQSLVQIDHALNMYTKSHHSSFHQDPNKLSLINLIPIAEERAQSLRKIKLSFDEHEEIDVIEESDESTSEIHLNMFRSPDKHLLLKIENKKLELKIEKLRQKNVESKTQLLERESLFSKQNMLLKDK